jgi:hypothetical protein
MEIGNSTDEVNRLCRVLVDQASELIAKLGVDVSQAPRFDTGPTEFREAANAYERLAYAHKQTGTVRWERAAVNGRNGDDLMQRLWNLRQELRPRGQQTAALGG